MLPNLIAVILKKVIVYAGYVPSSQLIAKQGNKYARTSKNFVPSRQRRRSLYLSRESLLRS